AVIQEEPFYKVQPSPTQVVIQEKPFYEVQPSPTQVVIQEEPFYEIKLHPKKTFPNPITQLPPNPIIQHIFIIFPYIFNPFLNKINTFAI
ncbi:MAG: hypothetical protein ABI855_20390, partial [Bacteroidota bacterium]